MSSPQLACAQCVAEHKGNAQAQFPKGFTDQAEAATFAQRHPVQAAITMINGTGSCMDHVQVGSTAAQMLLAPLTR